MKGRKKGGRKNKICSGLQLHTQILLVFIVAREGLGFLVAVPRSV